MVSIEYKGVVKKATDKALDVVVALGSQKSRIVHFDQNRYGLQEGDQVKVVWEERSGFFIMFWGYVFPIGLFGGTFLIFYVFVKNYSLSCLLSAIFLFPYYSLLWLFRNQIQGIYKLIKI